MDAPRRSRMADWRRRPTARGPRRAAAGPPVTPELEQIVGRAQELPLALAGGEPPTLEASRPPALLELTEHRFDDRGALPVERLGPRPREASRHRLPEGSRPALEALGLIESRSSDARHDEQLRTARRESSDEVLAP